MAYTVGSLFSGIGGFELGFERAGFDVRWQVEIDPFCRAVLAKHWPDVRRYDDVRTCGAANLEPVDVVCGGFPCQPVSHNGHQAAAADPRWLWPHVARVVRDLRPSVVALENVSGLLARGLDTVLGDLAALRYDAEWESLPAATVGSPQIRDRVFVVAYPDSVRCETGQGVFPEDAGSRLQPEAIWGVPHRGHSGRTRRIPDPGVLRVGDGTADWLDRLRVIGNAVVPQVAEVIAWRVRARLEAAA